MLTMPDPAFSDVVVTAVLSVGTLTVFRVFYFGHPLPNTYYAKVFFRADGAEHFVDSRPSDAVALALNRKIPILVNKKLLRRELTPEEIKEYEEICKTVKF